MRYSKINLSQSLQSARKQLRTHEEELLNETKRILANQLFSDKKILEHLGKYIDSFALIDEECVDKESVYTPAEIKKVAVNYRLKFLDSKHYKGEIPYEAILKIKQLNTQFGKELGEFKILAPYQAYSKKETTEQALLFVKTNHENYFLLHQWGEELSSTRSLKYWPYRSFENLGISVILLTLTLAALLPTWAITLDAKATYWSGYRGGVFFHLLIFNSAFTTFFFSAFAKNFSNVLWNRKNDYD